MDLYNQPGEHITGLTWSQDGDGGEEGLLLLQHVQLTDAVVEVKHRRYELVRYTCRTKVIMCSV